MAEDYRSTAQRLRSGQNRLADRFGQQQTTPAGGIGLLSTAVGPARFGASAAVRSFDDIRNLLGVLSTANKTNPVRKLIANELAAAEVAKRLAQPTALNAAKRATALVPVAGAMQAGSDPLGPLPPGMRPPAPYIKEAIPGRPGTEVGVGMPLPPLKQKMDQANATGTPSVMPYVEAGTDQAQNARERSFLERLSQSGLLSTLQGMARAERQYGVGPLAAFSESALDVQAARSAAEQEAAKRQSAASDRQAKILAEQIKKSGPMEFKGPMIKSIEKASSAKQSLDAINRYLELLSNKRIGGVGAKVEEGINAIGALFGAGGESGAATADSIRSQIITGLQMGVSQGQISQGDYEQLNKILSGSGWFVSNPKVESQLQRLKGVLGGKLSTTIKILEAQGIDPSYFSPDAPSGLVSARRPAQ